MTYFSKRRRNCYFSSLTLLQIVQSGESCILIFNRNKGRGRKSIWRSNGLLFHSIVKPFLIAQLDYFFLLKIVLVLYMAISI